MTTFTLDTSGFVLGVEDERGVSVYHYFRELAPFTQGFVEGLFASLAIPPFTEHPHLAILNAMGRQIVGFSDLSPEAVELILKDCAADQEVGRRLGGLEDRTSAKAGRAFWKERQSGSLFDCPPLTVSLGDDGKVHLAVAS